MNESKKYSFNKADGIKILKGAGYAVGGTLCAYGLTIIGNLDLGTQTVLISSVCSILLNAGVKFFSGK